MFAFCHSPFLVLFTTLLLILPLYIGYFKAAHEKKLLNLPKVKACVRCSGKQGRKKEPLLTYTCKGNHAKARIKESV